MPKAGVIGSMVWDLIYGRDPTAAPVEEWGGIAYALAALDADLPSGWEFVPLIKVGRDLAGHAQAFLRTLPRVAPSTRFVEVPEPNNRVVLQYQSAERRCERLSGGVPPWTWPELGPMLRDLDALYVNFISGFELDLETAHALRRGFDGPIYADLHSLFLGVQPDGLRTLRPLPDAPSWFGCFDSVQVNDDEMRQLSPDPMALAAAALGEGVSLLVVTLGPRGAVYVAAPDAEGRYGGRAVDDAGSSNPAVSGTGLPPYRHSAIRTALIPAATADQLDPTGCGDVFGASLFCRLLAGDQVESAVRHAAARAARNVSYRGATGLSRHLRGELVTL